MIQLSALWLPILLSGVFIFIASSIIHMATPLHKGDYVRVPTEDKLADVVRSLNIPPGDYMMPRPATMQEMKTPQFAERVKAGPNLIMTVLPTGSTGMGRQLGLWFVFSLVVSAVAAYIAGAALRPGATFMEIARFAGTTAFMGFAAAVWPMHIWYRRALGTTIRTTIDAVIYALIISATLAWLWPKG